MLEFYLEHPYRDIRETYDTSYNGRVLNELSLVWKGFDPDLIDPPKFEFCSVPRSGPADAIQLISSGKS